MSIQNFINCYFNLENAVLFATGSAHYAFIQDPDLQKITGGVSLCFWGTGGLLLSGVPQSMINYLKQKVVKRDGENVALLDGRVGRVAAKNRWGLAVASMTTIALGVYFVTDGLFGVYKQFQPAAGVAIRPLIQRGSCYQFQGLSDPQISSCLDEREATIGKEVGIQVLRFEATDPKEKLLVLTAKYDHNNATEITNRKKWDILRLEKTYDIRYKVISSSQSICEEVKRAATYGKVSGIWMITHGDAQSLRIGQFEKPLSLPATQLSQSCFDPLKPKATIVLNGCETGQLANGIGSRLANFSQRIVYASTENVRDTHLEIDDSPLSAQFSSVNLTTAEKDTTRTFYPDGSYEEGRGLFVHDRIRKSVTPVLQAMRKSVVVVAAGKSLLSVCIGYTAGYATVVYRYFHKTLFGR